MDQPELRVPSDEARDIAEALSHRLGKSTTDVVVEALRRLEHETAPHACAEPTTAQRTEHEQFMTLVRSLQPYVVPGSTSDHRDMYDDTGLPV
jgi:hypothetical protein